MRGTLRNPIANLLCDYDTCCFLYCAADRYIGFLKKPLRGTRYLTHDLQEREFTMRMFLLQLGMRRADFRKHSTPNKVGSRYSRNSGDPISPIFMFVLGRMTQFCIENGTMMNRNSKPWFSPLEFLRAELKSSLCSEVAPPPPHL